MEKIQQEFNWSARKDFVQGLRELVCLPPQGR